MILTTPNQNSLRSIVSLIFRGHFVAFLDTCYPAHIMALTRLDLERIARECGMEAVEFYYTDHGGIPKFPQVTWQQITGNWHKGKWFSDNIAVVARKPQ